MEPPWLNISTYFVEDTSPIPVPLMTIIAIIMSLLTFIGTFGNLLVIGAVVVYPKLRSVHNVLIVNLAVADLIVTTIIIPLSISGAVLKTPFLGDVSCEIVASLTVTSCIASVYSMTNIAVERYIYICHNTLYNKLYNIITIPLMVFCIWMLALLIDLPNFRFIGWGKHGFTPETQSCTFHIDKAVKSGYIWFLMGCAWVSSLTIICFCYTRLYMFVRQGALGEGKVKKVSCGSLPAPRIKAADRELIKILAFIVAFFLLMWTPFSFFSILNACIKVPHWILFITGHLCLANSSINFMIYAFSKDFRNGYQRVLKTIGRRRRGRDL